MEFYESGLLMVGLLLLLLIAGVPIAFALAGAGIVGLASDRSWRSIEFVLGTFSYSNTAQFGYVVVPLFLFMGHMAFSAGLSRSAFEAGQQWLGRFHGGLAAATIFACAAFSTICGSSVATASTMARIALPEMLRHGYKQRLAAGCVATGGTLGVLIPPSGILVIYSIVTQVSLAQLFLAAIVPGVMTAIIYILGIWLMVKIDPSLAGPRLIRRYSWREHGRAAARTWELLLLFALVMGSIYLGIATPTEAAALGAFFSLLAVLRRPNRWRNIAEGLRETGSATCSIFALIIGAGIFSLGLTTTQLPQHLAASVGGLNLSADMLVIVILLPYLVLGMFLDGISLVLITVPLVFPLIDQVGFNPVLFGLLITKAVEIGCITPPVGLNTFVVKSTAPELSLSEVFRGCVPFVLMEIFIVGLMIAFPQISLFLITP